MKESRKTKDKKFKEKLKETFKKMFKGKYVVSIKCKNCKHISEVVIPKGRTIIEYKKEERAICLHCGVRFDNISLRGSR